MVYRQAVLAHEPADAAAERQATHPDGRVIAGGESQAVRVQRLGDLAPGEASAQPRDPRRWVEFERLHQREVEDDAAIDDAVVRETVAAAAHRQFEMALAGKVDGGHHIGDGCGAHDHERASRWTPNGCAAPPRSSRRRAVRSGLAGGSQAPQSLRMLRRPGVVLAKVSSVFMVCVSRGIVTGC